MTTRGPVRSSPPWPPSKPMPPGRGRHGRLPIARAAYEYARDYAKERQAFGKPIIMNQAYCGSHARRHGHRDRRQPPPLVLARRLAGQQRRLHQRRGQHVQAQGGPHPATWVTERAIQILGGYGAAHAASTPSSASTATPRSWTIFEGTPSRSSSSSSAGPYLACVWSRSSFEVSEALRLGKPPHPYSIPSVLDRSGHHQGLTSLAGLLHRRRDGFVLPVRRLGRAAISPRARALGRRHAAWTVARRAGGTGAGS